MDKVYTIWATLATPLLKEIHSASIEIQNPGTSQVQRTPFAVLPRRVTKDRISAAIGKALAVSWSHLQNWLEE